MTDFDFEEEDPYFDEEDEFEFDPCDDWDYNLYDYYDVVNRNRPDDSLKIGNEIYSLGGVFGQKSKVDAFYQSQKQRFGDADKSASYKEARTLQFYLDPKTDQLFARIERNPDGKDVVRLTEKQIQMNFSHCKK